MYNNFNNIEGFYNSCPDVKNVNNIINNSYSQAQKNAFIFFGLDITSGKVTDPNRFDNSINLPDFLTNYLIILNMERENVNSEILKLLESLKNRRDQSKQKTIDNLEAKYNNLTSALKQYENDEKQTWLNLNTAKDNNFLKKREAYLIQEKLNKLKKERDVIFNDLTNEYNNLTKYKSNVLKLRDRNEYISKFQSKTEKKNNKQINALNQDILTKRRQSQINMDKFFRQNNTLYYLKIVFIFFLLALIPIILANNDIFLNKKTGSLTSFVILVIGLLIIIGRAIDNMNRSKLLWSEREFPASFTVSDEGKEDEDDCNKNPKAEYSDYNGPAKGTKVKSYYSDGKTQKYYY